MNDLTAEAIRRDVQEVRNQQRLSAWAHRWREHTGEYPPSYRGAAACERTEDHALYQALVPPLRVLRAPGHRPGADIIIHPAFFERHGNQGLVRFPRRRGQYQGARLPQPPNAA